MYFRLVCSPKYFVVASRGKSTCKLFRQATELMVLMDHVIKVNRTSPAFASLPCPFHMGVSPPLGKRLIGVFWDRHRCEKPK